MGLFSRSKPEPRQVAQPQQPLPQAVDMQEIIFKMRFSSKTIGRQAAKSEKQIIVEQNKAKEALKKDNLAGARIHAENAIRNRSEQIGYLKLQSQLEAVAAKLHSQQFRSQVTKDMGVVTQNLNVALGSMNANEISQTMETFIKQSEDLDLQTKYMDSAIGESVSSATPETQVNGLLQRIADQNNIEFNDKLLDVNAPIGMPGLPSTSAPQKNQYQNDSDLQARLDGLNRM